MSHETVTPEISKSARVGWPVYLMAAVVSAGISVAIAKYAETSVPMPPEYMQLIEESEGNTQTEAAMKARSLLIANEEANLRRLLAALGIGIAIVFGMASGLGSSAPGRGLIAALAGAIAVTGLAWVVSPHLVQLQNKIAFRDLDSFVQAISIHSASWSVIVSAFAISIGVGTASIKEFLQALLVGLLGAVIGVIAVVLLGATLEQFSRLEAVFIGGEKTKMLWAGLPVLTFGLMYAWSAFRTPPEISVPGNSAPANTDGVA